MYDIHSVLSYIVSLNFSFSDEDSFAITPEWIHSTSFDFLLQLQKQFPGEISSCEPDGMGYYMHPKS